MSVCMSTVRRQCAQCRCLILCQRDSDSDLAWVDHVRGCNERKAAYDAMIAPMLETIDDGRYYLSAIPGFMAQQVRPGYAIRQGLLEHGFSLYNPNSSSCALLMPIDEAHLFSYKLEA